MAQLMAIINLTPDSFYGPSRATAAEALERIRSFQAAGASIIDIGAVSTRPGAAPVSARTEWRRLAPVLRELAASDILPSGLASGSEAQLRGRSLMQMGKVPGANGEGPIHKTGPSPLRISIDTTRAEIVRKAFKVIGPFIVNDISAGEDDPEMLPTVAEPGLPFIAMHKRGNPQTMNGLCDYPNGVMAELLRYFGDFAERAERLGIRDWILDPGLGFAKTNDQCWEILEHLEKLKVFGRPILIGAADKRFTKEIPPHILEWYKAANGESRPDGTTVANALALAHGANILRVHRLP